MRPFDAQRSAIGDRRYLGGFDARFHSTSQCAQPLPLSMEGLPFALYMFISTSHNHVRV